ncbi:hypothetical protein H6P81_017860 [Aristolochia fimbriata]|uniref:40S ribosomal protein S27 n=1 Tax=Aristolochia fimbriata TaxID=158543 RepID=A0AAV7E2H2_ARIFI|nr:hypothetical protein H6P81_017860 [Aristolochia fimbriata]
MVLPNDIDLLNPPSELEKRRHKLKRLVQTPNSFFMDVKCQGCFNITTVFSHSQIVLPCQTNRRMLLQKEG